METQNELNKEILIIKTKIQQAFPELNGYLNEMPEYDPSFDKSGVNRLDLKDYLDSLKGILANNIKGS